MPHKGKTQAASCYINTASLFCPVESFKKTRKMFFLNPDTVVGDLHEQVAAEIRRAIAEGEAGPGERLPPARDLAAVLDVNTNTVLRALRQLRDEGLLDFRRGRGITVAATPDYGEVVAAARELVRLARRHGYRRDELVRIIESVDT